MARIRTIKPAFFRHVGLFDAERETGLPLRIAFAGLWTVCDREGRFCWEPRTLKLDCLPHDDVDFSRVLDALTTRGFVVRYVVDGRHYGYVPTFLKHQIINNREAASEIPEPNETNMLTRDQRVDDACPTPLDPALVEGKGREEEGKGKDIRTRRERVREPDGFEDFWKAYPKRDGANPKTPAREQFIRAIRSGASPEEIIHGIRRFAERERKNVGTQFIPQAVKWLRNKCWEGDAPEAEQRTAGTFITPQSPSWQPWRRYNAAKGRGYAVSEMDRIEATCGQFPVPTEYPPEAEHAA